jgi:hypothetical protein
MPAVDVAPVDVNLSKLVDYIHGWLAARLRPPLPRPWGYVALGVWVARYIHRNPDFIPLPRLVASKSVYLACARHVLDVLLAPSHHPTSLALYNDLLRWTKAHAATAVGHQYDIHARQLRIDALNSLETVNTHILYADARRAPQSTAVHVTTVHPWSFGMLEAMYALCQYANPGNRKPSVRIFY